MNNKCIATGVQLQKYFGSSEVQLEVIEYIATSLFITCPLILSCQNYVISHLSLGTQCNPLTYYGNSTHQGENFSKKAFLSSCNGGLISESISNLVPSKNCPSTFHFSLNMLCVEIQHTFMRMAEVYPISTFTIFIVNLKSDTFSNPIFQKFLQNQPSSPITSIPGCFA